MKDKGIAELDNNNVTTQEKRSDDWLKILETQSWQAELIISGLIITGLLKLPNWIKDEGQSYLLNSTDSSSFFLEMMLMFLMTAGYALIIFFTAHFIMRTIWIALLGLNSVYPNGINPNSNNSLGPSYWKKLKKEFPDLSAYNQELDDKCSLIFSQACQVTIMIISLCVLIYCFYIIFIALVMMFPKLREYAIHISVALYFLFSIIALTIQHFAKKYPDSPKMNKTLERYSNIIGRFFSLYVFKKPLSYISGILSSNTKPNKLILLGVMLVSCFMGFMAGKETKENPIYHYFGDSNRYMTFNDRPYQFFNFNYENLRDQNTLPFTPFIQSDVISGDYIKLYIPTVMREMNAAGIKKLNLFERFKMDRAERDKYHQDQISDYVAFNQVMLNGKLIDITDAMYYEYDLRVEEGILVYIPTKDCQSGRNILQIKKNYFLDDVQKIVTIPFYFENT